MDEPISGRCRPPPCITGASRVHVSRGPAPCWCDPPLPAMPGEVLEGSGRAILTAEEAAPVEAPPVTLHLLGVVDGAAAGTAFVAASPVGHGGSAGGERFVNGSVLHHPGSRRVGLTGSFQPGLRRSSIGEQAGGFANWLKKKKSDLPPREKFLCSDQLLSPSDPRPDLKA